MRRLLLTAFILGSLEAHGSQKPSFYLPSLLSVCHEETGECDHYAVSNSQFTMDSSGLEVCDSSGCYTYGEGYILVDSSPEPEKVIKPTRKKPTKIDHRMGFGRSSFVDAMGTFGSLGVKTAQAILSSTDINKAGAYFELSNGSRIDGLYNFKTNKWSIKVKAKGFSCQCGPDDDF